MGDAGRDLQRVERINAYSRLGEPFLNIFFLFVRSKKLPKTQLAIEILKKMEKDLHL